MTRRRPLGYDFGQSLMERAKLRLDSTVVSQPALFVASLAALETLRQDEPAAAGNCVATAGGELGEYTALAFADALSFTDGLRWRCAAKRCRPRPTPRGEEWSVSSGCGRCGH